MAIECIQHQFVGHWSLGLETVQAELQRVGFELPHPHSEAAPTVRYQYNKMHFVGLLVVVSWHLFAEFSPALGTRDLRTHFLHAYRDKTVFCNLVRLLHEHALLDNSVDGLEAARDLG